MWYEVDLWAVGVVNNLVHFPDPFPDAASLSCRLLALSRGESELTFSTWQAIKDLEVAQTLKPISFSPPVVLNVGLQQCEYAFCILGLKSIVFSSQAKF